MWRHLANGIEKTAWCIAIHQMSLPNVV